MRELTMTKDEIRKHLASGAFAGDHKFEILLSLLLEIADGLAIPQHDENCQHGASMATCPACNWNTGTEFYPRAR